MYTHTLAVTSSNTGRLARKRERVRHAFRGTRTGHTGVVDEDVQHSGQLPRKRLYAIFRRKISSDADAPSGANS